MEVQQYEEALLAEIRQLPPEHVREVLDFAAFLRYRLAQQADLLQARREKAAARMSSRRQRIGPIDVKAADLVEAGRAARVAEILPEGQSR
jgi:hypothetical protein